MSLGDYDGHLFFKEAPKKFRSLRKNGVSKKLVGRKKRRRLDFIGSTDTGWDLTDSADDMNAEKELDRSALAIDNRDRTSDRSLV